MKTTELSKEISCDNTIHMLISAAFAVVVLAKIDEMMSGDDLYPAMRPLIASSLLYAAYKCTSVEPAG